MSTEAKEELKKEGTKKGDAMRARAANRDLLMVNLSDPEARIARIVLEHVADVLDGQPEPKIERPTVMKRPGV